jgi:hypothetical protein
MRLAGGNPPAVQLTAQARGEEATILATVPPYRALIALLERARVAERVRYPTAVGEQRLDRVVDVLCRWNTVVDALVRVAKHVRTVRVDYRRWDGLDRKTHFVTGTHIDCTYGMIVYTKRVIYRPREKVLEGSVVFKDAYARATVTRRLVE